MGPEAKGLKGLRVPGPSFVYVPPQHFRLPSALRTPQSAIRLPHLPGRPSYSQRNTLADSAVQQRPTASRTATSVMCADHGSPCQMPLSSETA